MGPDREGTFRGTVLEHKFDVTKNGYPQWVAHLAVTEIHVPEAEREDWTGYEFDEHGFTDISEFGWTVYAYTCMFTNDKNTGEPKEILGYSQVQAATGWDGADFQALNDMDLSTHAIQFRCQNDTWNGKTELKVQWIDPVGPVMGGQGMRPMDGDIAAVTAKYASLLNRKNKPAAAKAPAKAKSTKSVPPKTAPRTKAPKPAPAPTPDATPAPTLTKNEAWDKVAAAFDDETDAVNAWVEGFKELFDGVDEEDVTDAQWTQIATHIVGEAS